MIALAALLFAQAIGLSVLLIADFATSYMTVVDVEILEKILPEDQQDADADPPEPPGIVAAMFDFGLVINFTGSYRLRVREVDTGRAYSMTVSAEVYFCLNVGDIVQREKRIGGVVGWSFS